MPTSIRASQLDTTTGTISTINSGDSASEGTGEGVSRRDHQHAISNTGTPSTIQPDDAAAVGSSGGVSRSDHTHAIVAAAPSNGIGAANTEGSSTSFARADHDHTISESGAQELTLGAISDGQLVERSGTTLAGTTAVDDTQHGTRSGGALHADATTSVDGFMSAADKLKLDALIDPRYRTPKDSVRALETGNRSLTGAATVDDIVLATGDRVGCFLQTTVTEDGIYVVDTGGAWARSADFVAGDGAAGSFFAVEEGTANGDSTWLVIDDEGSDVIGTDGLSVSQVGSGSPRSAGDGLLLNGNALDVTANADGSIVVGADDVQVGILATDAQHGVRGGGTQHADVIAAGADGFMTGADKTKLNGVSTGATVNTPQQERVTTEAVTGSDTALADTLAQTPISNSAVVLFFNGVQQIQGAGEDYTISGSTITWLASTGTAVDMTTGDDLVAVYQS